MDFQSAPAAQRPQRRARDFAEARLDRRAVGNEAGDMLADGA